MQLRVRLLPNQSSFFLVAVENLADLLVGLLAASSHLDQALFATLLGPAGASAWQHAVWAWNGSSAPGQPQVVFLATNLLVDVLNLSTSEVSDGFFSLRRTFCPPESRRLLRKLNYGSCKCSGRKGLPRFNRCWRVSLRNRPSRTTRC